MSSSYCSPKDLKESGRHCLWVKSMRDECVSRNITFCFMETGTVFFKDGKEYRIRNKQLQNQQAVRSGLTFKGKPMHFKLKDADGIEIPKDKLYVPHYAKKCSECSFRILCNGCFNCGACEGWACKTCQSDMLGVGTD